MAESQIPILGGHLSLGRKPRATVEWAARHGFGSMQIFASSPGAWRPPLVHAEQAADFVRARQEHGVEPLFIHAIYLINLASANPDLVAKSRLSLIATLNAGATLRAAGVVTHIGSHAGRGFEAVAEQIAAQLEAILHATPEGPDLILESSAGAGGIVGSRIEELGTLLDLAGRPERLKIGLDSAHLYASGWNFGVPETARELVQRVDEYAGLDRLVLMHANDSAQPLGSRKDRHARIGEGYIGLEGFRNLLAQPALRRIPWVLETPDLSEEDAELRIGSLRRLQALAAESMELDHAT